MDKAKIAELLAKARAKQATARAEIETRTAITYEYLGKEVSKPEFEELVEELVQDLEDPKEHEYTTAAGKQVVLNERQLEFAGKCVAGENIVLIGKAGTGKTTCVGVGISELMKTNRIKPMSSGTKHLQVGLPGVCVVSFTNKAVNNIRRQMPADLKPHTITIHKLLEFKPVKYEVLDGESGMYKTTMRFEPSRNAYNPLPSDLVLMCWEESSMTSVELHQLVMDALQHECQHIYLGDIRQLPPVMGTAILGFKMLEIPVVELEEVYRTALLSPILRLALAIDDGKVPEFNGTVRIKDAATGKWRWPVLERLNETGEYGSVKVHPWQKPLSPDLALMTAIKFMTTLEAGGADLYDPQDDIILCPFNKAFGTIELNKGIAQYLGVKRGATVHEVISGFEKHYLAVGDRVLYNKEDAFITAIARNDEYMGKRPQLASPCLNRWGHVDNSIAAAAKIDLAKTKQQQEKEAAEFDLTAIENFLEKAASELEDRVTAASHVITIRFAGADEDDEGAEIDLEKATEVNNLLGGYAITVHKSQGSEYNKVFILLHQSHNTMISRELLYTACTRAAKALYIICEPDSLSRGINSQRIKGNTLAEKAEFFKGKMDKYLEMTSGDATETQRIAGLKSAVKQAVNRAVINLNKAYPNKPPVIIKDITYEDKGNAAGTAYLGTGIINISPLYLNLSTEEMLRDTVPHEVAHVYAHEWFRDNGHGTAWQQLCVEAGGTGAVYHDMGNAAQLRGRSLQADEDSKKPK